MIKQKNLFYQLVKAGKNNVKMVTYSTEKVDEGVRRDTEHTTDTLFMLTC